MRRRSGTARSAPGRSRSRSGPPAAEAAEQPSAPPDRLAVARALRETGLLLGLTGANPFRVRAYERAARALEALSSDLEPLLREERLTDVPGIGPALAATIAEIHRTGRSQQLERLRGAFPPGVLELLRVPGLGVERIAALHQALGVRTIDELRVAAETGRVRGVPGFGQKMERRLLEAIRSLEAVRDRVRLDVALQQADALVEYLRASPRVKRAEIAGSVRRGVETVGNVDLSVASTAPAAVLDHFLALPLLASVVERDRAHAAGHLVDGLRVDVRAAPPARFGALWLRQTGSAAHLARLEALARERGVPGALRAAREEEEVYGALGLPFLPAELREDHGELEAAAAGTLPGDLVREEDVRGLVHCHTLYSDGTATVEQMARGADALGMEYITITDHSPAAFYAGGLRLDRLQAQWDEIAKVQEKVRVRILRGTECDILPDGSLDYPDAVLEKLDVVIASIHARSRMEEDEMTRRLVRAMRHPLFKVWGHALGRLINRRPPLPCRVEEVLDALAASRGAIEVNGDPRRLDMEPRWIRAARSQGLRFVLSTDAHSVGALQNVRYAALTARRGWVRRGEVLNTLAAERFQRAVRPLP